jgi:hypothetical protein
VSPPPVGAATTIGGEVFPGAGEGVAGIAAGTVKGAAATT